MSTDIGNGGGEEIQVVENTGTSIGAMFAASKFIARASRNRRYACSIQHSPLGYANACCAGIAIAPPPTLPPARSPTGFSTTVVVVLFYNTKMHVCNSAQPLLVSLGIR